MSPLEEKTSVQYQSTIRLVNDSATGIGTVQQKASNMNPNVPQRNFTSVISNTDNCSNILEQNVLRACVDAEELI